MADFGFRSLGVGNNSVVWWSRVFWWCIGWDSATEKYVFILIHKPYSAHRGAATDNSAVCCGPNASPYAISNWEDNKTYTYSERSPLSFCFSSYFLSFCNGLQVALEHIGAQPSPKIKKKKNRTTTTTNKKDTRFTHNVCTCAMCAVLFFFFFLNIYFF